MHLQETTPVRKKIRNLLSCIAALEGNFGVPMYDVVEQMRWDELIWYTTPPSFRLGSEVLTAGSGGLRDNCGLCWRSQGSCNLLIMAKMMKKSPDCSKSCKRLLLTIRFVHNHVILFDADKDNRWCSKWQHMIRDAN